MTSAICLSLGPEPRDGAAGRGATLREDVGAEVGESLGTCGAYNGKLW